MERETLFLRLSSFTSGDWTSMRSFAIKGLILDAKPTMMTFFAMSIMALLNSMGTVCPVLPLHAPSGGVLRAGNFSEVSSNYATDMDAFPIATAVSTLPVMVVHDR